MIKVILTEHVDHLGKAGELHAVKDGYARNFLFPGGLAVLATPAMERQVSKELDAREKRQQRAIEALQAEAAALAGKTIVIKAKVSDKGHMFGSVTAKQIQEALAEQIDLVIGLDALDLAAPLKEVGEHSVGVKLADDIRASIKVNIEADATPSKRSKKAAK